MLSDFSQTYNSPTDEQLHTAICECGNAYYTDAIHVWTKCGWCKEVDQKAEGWRWIGVSLVLLVVILIWVGPNP